MLKRIKDWLWLVVVGVIGLLFVNRKPKWMKQKEQEIKERDKQMNAALERMEDISNDYEEIKNKHDNAIKEAGEGEEQIPFNNPDSAADFIDGVLNARKGK